MKFRKLNAMLMVYLVIMLPLVVFAAHEDDDAGKPGGAGPDDDYDPSSTFGDRDDSEILLVGTITTIDKEITAEDTPLDANIVSNENSSSFTMTALNGNVPIYETSLSFNYLFTTKNIQLNLDSGQNELKLKIVHNDDEVDYAHIDFLALKVGDKEIPPVEVIDLDSKENILYKVLMLDNDVVDVTGHTLEAKWENIDADNVLLIINAREEILEELPGVPFNVPNNLDLNDESTFIEYQLKNDGKIIVDGKIEDNDELGNAQVIQYMVPVTGHPPGYTYFYIKNDENYLYISEDFTGDNTLDKEDWSRIYIFTERGLKEFEINENSEKYGKSGYVYTNNVNYQHMVNEFKIPLSEINAKPNDIIKLGFSLYGTYGYGGGTESGGADVESSRGDWGSRGGTQDDDADSKQKEAKEAQQREQQERQKEAAEVQSLNKDIEEKKGSLNEAKRAVEDLEKRGVISPADVEKTNNAFSYMEQSLELAESTLSKIGTRASGLVQSTNFAIGEFETMVNEGTKNAEDIANEFGDENARHIIEKIENELKEWGIDKPTVGDLRGNKVKDTIAELGETKNHLDKMEVENTPRSTTNMYVEGGTPGITKFNDVIDDLKDNWLGAGSVYEGTLLENLGETLNNDDLDLGGFFDAGGTLDALEEAVDKVATDNLVFGGFLALIGLLTPLGLVMSLGRVFEQMNNNPDLSVVEAVGASLPGFFLDFIVGPESIKIGIEENPEPEQPINTETDPNENAVGRVLTTEDTNLAVAIQPFGDGTKARGLGHLNQNGDQEIYEKNPFTGKWELSD